MIEYKNYKNNNNKDKIQSSLPHCVEDFLKKKDLKFLNQRSRFYFQLPVINQFISNHAERITIRFYPQMLHLELRG